MLTDGVSRATRAARLCPGSVIPAELDDDELLGAIRWQLEQLAPRESVDC
jgi:hypothetical protein